MESKISMQWHMPWLYLQAFSHPPLQARDCYGVHGYRNISYHFFYFLLYCYKIMNLSVNHFILLMVFFSSVCSSRFWPFNKIFSSRYSVNNHSKCPYIGFRGEQV